MNEHARTEGLSTADLAAADKRSDVEQGHGAAGEEDVTPAPQDGAAPSVAGERAQAGAHSAPLFSPDEAEAFRSRWGSIQAGFVDDPRHSAEQADGLVAEVIKRLAEVFAEERDKLESQWSRGDDVSTEDLRIALQRYRSFFDRLLSV